MTVKDILKVIAGTVLILFLALVATQFSNEVEWTLSDFVVMGTLLFVAGILLTLALKVRTKTRRMVMASAVLLGFFYVWAELAVGVFTNIGS